ncbi:MAG: hypothetical protein V4858_19865 [Pseudomonadota bacterium]
MFVGCAPFNGGCTTASVAAKDGGECIVLLHAATICAPSHGKAVHGPFPRLLSHRTRSTLPVFDSVQMEAKTGTTVDAQGDSIMHTNTPRSKPAPHRNASKLRVVLAYLALWILTSLVAGAFIAGWSDLQ